jgi:hypothetical protein
LPPNSLRIWSAVAAMEERELMLGLSERVLGAGWPASLAAVRMAGSRELRDERAPTAI